MIQRRDKFEKYLELNAQHTVKRCLQKKQYPSEILNGNGQRERLKINELHF